ncbi:MAG: 30S ribosomal protein S9 [Candidatus Azambacteria bacterium]|nr:30S ribosomal protein S9 [Candidatus Azambacteria bacterium]
MAIKKQKTEKKTDKYYEAVGRRKTAVARVRVKLNTKKREATVNGKDFADYFKEKEQQDVLISPLVRAGVLGFMVSIKVSGGGLRAQAYASRHGLSRALILAHPEFKPVLKTLGFLTRDPRMKERKKPGLKGARRAPQWSKR